MISKLNGSEKSREIYVEYIFYIQSPSELLP